MRFFQQNPRKRVSLHYGRQDDKRAKTPMYGKHQGQGHQARDARASLPALTRLPLQSQRTPAPRYPRHRPAQIQNRHLYKRLFLARPRRLQIFRTAQEQYPILAAEDREKQGT